MARPQESVVHGSAAPEAPAPRAQAKDLPSLDKLLKHPDLQAAVGVEAAETDIELPGDVIAVGAGGPVTAGFAAAALVGRAITDGRIVVALEFQGMRHGTRLSSCQGR